MHAQGMIMRDLYSILNSNIKRIKADPALYSFGSSFPQLSITSDTASEILSLVPSVLLYNKPYVQALLFTSALANLGLITIMLSYH